MTRAVLVPGVLALLPEYAGLEDPVADLRAACLAAVAWLREGDVPVTVLADPQGERVAGSLLAAHVTELGATPEPPSASVVEPVETRAYLAVGNGSARRTEKAPGHLDERAHAFDDRLREALVRGELTDVDRALGAELLASLDGIAALARVLPPGTPAAVDHDDDPYGVQYWVMRWEW